MKLERTLMLRSMMWAVAFALVLASVSSNLRSSTVGAQSIPNSLVPIQVPNLTNVIAVSAGGAGSMALTSTGQVWCWGDNQYGQLGNGTPIGGYSTVPVNVSTLSNVTAIASGGQTRLALTNAGRVYRWGSTGSGLANLPQPVPGLETNIIAIASGDFHCMALSSDGTVFTFGSNFAGQLGNGTTTDNYTPAQVPNLFGVVKIAAGGSHCLALKSNGTLLAWGWDFGCPLGRGGSCGDSYSAVPIQVAPFATVVGISAGEHYSLAVTPDSPGILGRMYAWGDNFSGQLGDGTWALDRSTPTLCPSLGGITKAVSGSGSNHTVIMLDDGSVWACGENTYGDLGNGTVAQTNIPQSCNALGYIVPAVDIACGFQHSLAALSDGTVWAFGRNQLGQLGVG